MNSFTGIKQFKCPQCDMKFLQKSNQKSHLKVHNGESLPMPWKCVHCPKTFAYKSWLSVHMRKHTGEKPYKVLNALRSSQVV